MVHLKDWTYWTSKVFLLRWLVALPSAGSQSIVLMLKTAIYGTVLGTPPTPPGAGHGSPAPPAAGWVGWLLVGVIDFGEGRSLCKCLSSYGMCRRFIGKVWIEKENGWEVVLHSLMLGPRVPGTIPMGGGLPGRRTGPYIAVKCFCVPMLFLALSKSIQGIVERR